MNTSNYTIMTTTVAGTTFSTVSLDTAEVSSATASFPSLAAATRAGLFSPITATATDTVAVEVKQDGSAEIVVVHQIPPVVTTVLGDTGSSGS